MWGDFNHLLQGTRILVLPLAALSSQAVSTAIHMRVVPMNDDAMRSRLGLLVEVLTMTGLSRARRVADNVGSCAYLGPHEDLLTRPIHDKRVWTRLARFLITFPPATTHTSANCIFRSHFPGLGLQLQLRLLQLTVR